jgi:RNA polymerase sigma-70 factor, ECF subfamily
VTDNPIARSLEVARVDLFRRLAAEHLDESYRLARAILRDPAEAEDATHDAFVRAWRRWSTLRDVERFDAWFGRILVNTCRNRLRYSARHRHQDLSTDLANQVRAGADPFRPVDDRDLLRSALSQLSPDHQVVVALRFFADLPIREIAARLGIREGTAHSRLHYALEHLRQALGEDDQPGATDD